jgi:DNA-binding CsgD family transcriptional regulator
LPNALWSSILKKLFAIGGGGTLLHPRETFDMLDSGHAYFPIALTPRELDVLQLAAQDLSGPAIASRLGVSYATVRTHCAHINAKLGVGSRAGAVAEGIRQGLIT